MAGLNVELLPHEVGKPACESLRQYIRELHEENDLAVISDEVNPDLELAAICRRAYELEDKAPLFNNIKGCHENGLFRILGAPVGASSLPGKRFIRIAKSLGLPSNATAHEIIHKFNAAKKMPPIPPKEVESGPIKQFKLLGDEVYPLCIAWNKDWCFPYQGRSLLLVRGGIFSRAGMVRGVFPQELSRGDSGQIGRKVVSLWIPKLVCEPVGAFHAGCR